MTSTTTERAPRHLDERREQAARLDHLTANEVARRIGVSSTTIRRWRDPEYAERERRVLAARREASRRPCPECGRLMTHALGNPPRVCRECAPEHYREEARARRLIWTPERVIAAIQRWAAEHDGRPPTSLDWKAQGPYWPNRSVAVKRFGNWSDAIEAAGFPRPARGQRRVLLGAERETRTQARQERREVLRRGPEPVWPRERCIAAIQRWAAENGRPPRIPDWPQAEEYWPQAYTVVKRFGSWRAAIIAAGFPEPGRGRPPRSEEVTRLDPQVALARDALRASGLSFARHRRPATEGIRVARTWLTDEGEIARPPSSATRLGIRVRPPEGQEARLGEIERVLRGLPGLIEVRRQHSTVGSRWSTAEEDVHVYAIYERRGGGT